MERNPYTKITFPILYLGARIKKIFLLSFHYLAPQGNRSRVIKKKYSKRRHPIHYPTTPLNILILKSQKFKYKIWIISREL